MKQSILALALSIFVTDLVAADNSCRDIGIQYLQQPVKSVRALAEHCDSPKLADLYYKRAYHLELLERNYASQEGIYRYHGGYPPISEYRLYIAMLESLAPVWFPEIKARVDFLRREYDHRGEVVELRLRGFDRIADRLERKRHSVH